MPRKRKVAAPGLSREKIVAAALAQVDRHGLEAISMRKLGDTLGVEAMSLYHFFPSKQHLVDALVDRAIDSVEFPPESLPPVERMRRTMRAYRDMAHRFGRLYPVIAVHRLNTRTGVTFIEKVLKIACDICGDEETAARSFRALGYYLMGAALDETMGYSKGPSAAEPVDGAFIARECPLLARSARYFQRDQWDRTFEQGMEDMLHALTERCTRTPAAGKSRGRSTRSGRA
jgi:AcrR family transcriptional regulator